MNTRAVIIRLVYEELIRVEESRPFRQCIRWAKCLKYGTIEALAGLQISNPQMNVVDEPSQVKLHYGRLLA